MKTLKQLLSKTKPDTRNFAKPTDDLDKFVGKHEIEVVADANGNGDEVFKGSKVKYVDRSSERHGYDKPEDERVNEEVLSEGDESHKMFQDYHAEIAKDLKGIHKALFHHYNVVTSKKGPFKGEAQWHHVEAAKQMHRALADIHQQVRQHIDYSKPISMKEDVDLEEKKLTPAELKKREEVARAIERENPNMPMAKKMAIATATAKKVAEDKQEYQDGVPVTKYKGKPKPRDEYQDGIPVSKYKPKKVAEEVEETSLEEDMIDLYLALDEDQREEFISILETGSDEELLEYVEQLGEEING